MGNIVRMRNKNTGEIVDFDDSSSEFRAAQAQLDKSGIYPLYEQTGDHHMVDVRARAAEGELTPSDLGKDHEPLPDAVGDASAVAPEANPHLALSPAEVEAGLTPEKKQEELRETFGMDEEDSPFQRREKTFDEARGVIGDDVEPESEEATPVRRARRQKRGSGTQGKQTGNTVRDSGNEPPEGGDA